MTDEDYIRKKFRDMDASTDQSLKGLMWDSAQVRKVIRERERERERERKRERERERERESTTSLVFFCLGGCKWREPV